MNPKLRYPWTIAVGLVLTMLTPVVVVSLSVGVARQVTRLPADAAFRADGVTVTQDAVQRRIRVLEALYGLRPPPDPARYDAFTRAAASMVAMSTVLGREASRQGLEISGRQDRDLLAGFITRQVRPPTQEGFVRFLRDAGLAESDVVAELRRQQASAELYHRITDAAVASVTEEAARQYFVRHAAQLRGPERRQLRNITVATKDQAQQLLSELRAGADFAATASENSLDEHAADRGGDLGLRTADQLQPDYAAAAFSAAPGAYFGPVHTSEGWELGQVVHVEPAVPVRYPDVHAQLLARLRQDAADRAWTAWLGGVLAKADITYSDNYRPAPGSPIAGVPALAAPAAPGGS